MLELHAWQGNMSKGVMGDSKYIEAKAYTHVQGDFPKESPANTYGRSELDGS